MLGHPGHPNLNSLQHQMQQGQQQQQNQQQPGPPGQQQNPNQGPPPNGQDYNLSNVLHFLQTEWRRYERDRNEWEIERAEMRARIALLEGERRSFENVKLDLLRRIKMLEYALRVERSKQLQPVPGISPAKVASLQGKDEVSHKDGSGSSSPRSEDSPLPGGAENRLSIGSIPGIPNGTGPGITSSTSVGGVVSALANAPSAPLANARPQTWAGIPNGVVAPTAVGKPPPGRDAKGRARSRDYLKQCLQEVNYLTSSQALNPLPNRPILTTAAAAPVQQPQPNAAILSQQPQAGPNVMQPNGAGLPLSLPNLPSFDSQTQSGFTGGNIQVQQHTISMSGFNGRPRKVVPEVGKDFPSLNGPQGTQAGATGLSTSPPNAPPPNPGLLGASEPPPRTGGSPNPISRLPIAGEGSDGLSLERQSSKQADEVAGGQSSGNEPSQLTAIFRPDPAGEWKERYRAASEAVERAKADEELENLKSSSIPGLKDEDEESMGDDEAVVGDGKLWKPRRTLRNHLDVVRALAFHPSEMCLATGGDDCTVKIWRMDATDLASNASQATEIEPHLTLRGHSAAISRLLISGSKGVIYSASWDSTVRIWALPPANLPTYAPYDASRAKGMLVGHTDAVWDLALLRDDTLLVSGGADGAVKVWDVSLPNTPLKYSWGYNGLDEVSDATYGITSVEGIKADLKKVAVAYANAVVKLFDIETGAEVGKLQSDSTFDGTPATQINKIVSHPTMNLLVTAHEDKFIRIFDITTGACTHSMLGHTDGVTSLSIDSAGFSLVSGGHDNSVRFWDLLSSRQCVQEMSYHRKKGDEGVLDVEYHQSLPFLASAGADGVVKLYASS